MHQTDNTMKQERHATTLAEDLQEASACTAVYGEFFTGLLGIIGRKPVDDALGERIQGYVLGWLEGHPLTEFDDYSATAYRRTYLGRSPETGWEAIVMSWKNGNRTSIHAHPQFAGYHIAGNNQSRCRQLGITIETIFATYYRNAIGSRLVMIKFITYGFNGYNGPVRLSDPNKDRLGRYGKKRRYTQ